MIYSMANGAGRTTDISTVFFLPMKQTGLQMPRTCDRVRWRDTCNSVSKHFFGEWLPCSFGSETMTWKERVWGVGLFTEGREESICDGGREVPRHSASCS